MTPGYHQITGDGRRRGDTDRDQGAQHGDHQQQAESGT
jgi:hypothetical protein